MKTITVKGTGRTSVKPDLIVITMRLETEAEEYEKTIGLAAGRIDALNKSLEEVGFEKQTVKTADFNIRADYQSVKDKNGNYKSVFKGYVCNHTLKIEFDSDMKRLSEALAAISGCVAKPEFSISFTVKDPSAVSRELLKSAARNAEEKAEILCAASGVKIGGLTSIDYNWDEISLYSDTNYKLESRCLTANPGLSNIDIEPDDIKAEDTATFVWEII